MHVAVWQNSCNTKIVFQELRHPKKCSQLVEVKQFVILDFKVVTVFYTTIKPTIFCTCLYLNLTMPRTVTFKEFQLLCMAQTFVKNVFNICLLYFRPNWQGQCSTFRHQLGIVSEIQVLQDIKAWHMGKHVSRTNLKKYRACFIQFACERLLIPVQNSGYREYCCQ